MRRGQGGGINLVFVLGAACLFVGLILAVMLMGAGVYQRISHTARDVTERRVGLSYLTEKIHASDSAGRVYVDSLGPCRALVLEEEYDGVTYQTFLYVWDGSLMELFCEKDLGLGPEDGEVLLPCRSLELEEGDGFILLRLTDSQGRTASAAAAVRSREGGGT